MNSGQAEQQRLHNQLIKLTQAWALRRSLLPEQAAYLRAQALLYNHRYYWAHIPVYRWLADQEGIGPEVDLSTIQRQLMSTDDLFKSYPQRLLDTHDYRGMTDWLTNLHHRHVEIDLTGVDSLDRWLDRLNAAGVRPVYSSGTSGAFSFIPRDAANWALTRLVNTCYLLPLLMYNKVGATWQQWLLGPATQWLSPARFVQLAGKANMQKFDSIFLDFQQGGTGMQAIGRELAPLFRRHHFLYETTLSADTLRLLTRGPRTPVEQQQLVALQAETVGKREAHFARLRRELQAATRAGQQIFLFGAPFLCKDFCEYLMASQQTVVLNPGSLLLFGGGWKTFSGQQMPRSALVALIGQALGLAPERIVEGYSMTEINVFIVRCDHGRFHIPPLLEPVIFDEALQPQTGKNLHGIFGFLDPLAISYPGFIISGDQVHLVDGECACGLSGPALTSIGRAQQREAKGCAGVMASVQA